MSFDATAWAWRQKCSSGPQKLVLLALADCANQVTGQCNPSHATLASKCDMSVATVKRTIEALEQAGLVSVRHASKAGCRTSNHYQLLSTGNRVNVTPIKARIGSQSTHNRVSLNANRVTVSYGIGSERAINQELEPGIEPINEPEQKEVSEEVRKARLAMLEDLKKAISGKHIPLNVTFEGPDLP